MKTILFLAASVALGTGVALAASGGDAERARILDGYAAQAKAPDFTRFSAERG